MKEELLRRRTARGGAQLGVPPTGNNDILNLSKAKKPPYKSNILIINILTLLP